MYRFLILFCLLTSGLNSGISQDFSAIDAIVDSYPTSFGSSELLTTRIQQDFDSSEHRVRAAFRWIAKNIQYDVKSYFSPPRPSFRFYSSEQDRQKRTKTIHDELVNIVLKNNMALCLGYSLLFKRVCTQMDVPNEVITGLSKSIITDIGRKRGVHHAWNAVKVADKWLMADVTWAAGYIDYGQLKFIPQFDEQHYLATPDKFLNNHYPDDPKWLMTTDAMSKSDFIVAPLILNRSKTWDIKLISPKSGLVHVKEKMFLELKITGLPPKPEVIAFFANKEAQVNIWPKEEAGVTTLRVKIPKPLDDELYIYVNRLPIVGFKLVTKLDSKKKQP